MYHAANFIIKQFNFCYDFYFSLFTLLYPFGLSVVPASLSRFYYCRCGDC